MKVTRILFFVVLICSLFPRLSMAEETPTDPAAAEAKPEVKIEDYVGYQKGFYVQTPDQKFRLLITGYIQEQFSMLFEEQINDIYTFRVRRARLKFSGNLYSTDVQYELEYDFSTSKLLNADLQLVYDNSLKFRLGQFYVPFDYENQASSSSLQFVERSIDNAFFGIPEQREPGAGFTGALFEDKLEYDVGIFNGEGINTSNTNKSFRYAGRFVYNIAGQVGYEYGDMKDSESPQVALGAAAMYNSTPDGSTIPVGSVIAAYDKTVTSLTGDLTAKYRRFSAQGTFFFQRTNPEAGSPTKGGLISHDKGWVGQAGYFVLPEKFEVAVRAAQVLVEYGNNLGEYTGGLNYYIFGGHRVKLQTNYSLFVVKDGISAGDDRVDHRVVAQLQLKI